MPDQFAREEALAWINRAAADLRAARLLTDASECSEALFHCQQAVEKALKGMLTYHRHAFRKTHDLSDLIGKCLAIDESLYSTMDGVDDLTQYAWRYRTHCAPQDPDPSYCAEGIAKAQVKREDCPGIGC
jgi:HEPN domain-containing protein